jgi:predicted dehydrogenase
MSSSPTIRVAVLGAGTVGQLRTRSVRHHPETELVAVADANEALARQAASETRAEVFTDYRALLDRVPIDLAIVSSPIHVHEDMALAAFEAGAHVLCEKPLSNSVASCSRMLDVARRRGRVLAVGFNHRYYPAVQFLKRVVDRGEIGDIDHVRVFGGHDGLHNFRAEWMYKAPLSGGGAMMDVGIHMTDLTRFVLGEIAEVYGSATGKIWKVPGSEDNALVIMKSDGGVPAIYQATWTEWKGYRIFIEVYGHLGMVRAYYAPMFNLLVTQDRPGGRRRRPGRLYPQLILREKLQGWQSTTYASFQAELADLLRRLRGERVPLADGWSGLRAVEIAAAVRDSTASGAPITLSRP